MKKLLVFAIAIFLLAGFTSKVMAQGVTTTAATTASAKILQAMTLTTGATQLNFGTMTVPTTVATVVVPPTGTISKTGTITLLSQIPIASPAAYTVTGDINAAYSITVPLSDVVLSANSNADHMNVNTFITNKTLNKSALDGTGNDAFTVGATLNLAASQAAGSYSGSFNVYVNYN